MSSYVESKKDQKNKSQKSTIKSRSNKKLSKTANTQTSNYNNISPKYVDNTTDMATILTCYNDKMHR